VLHRHDVLCPFYYVGQPRNAIFESHGFEVADIPFQAHPEIPLDGRTVGPRSGAMDAHIEEEARAAGLPLNWPARLPNPRMVLAAAEWSGAARPSLSRRWTDREGPGWQPSASHRHMRFALIETRPHPELLDMSPGCLEGPTY
jgi:hypothetical protein